MSGMSFLERLLDSVTVEWKPLGEIGEFVRGSGLQKSDFTNSGIGCIHYGQIYTFYGDYAYQTKSFVSPTLAAKLRKAQKSDLIIATTSENIEDVCKTLVWLGEEEVCVSGETYIFKHNQNPKYLAYYLKTPSFFDFKKRNRTGTKVIRVHGDRLATFQIPIPCPDNPDRSLAIQAEIVRILDTFTALTAELTAELNDRQKQYNYYRDRLLTFEEGEVEWKTLGEVAKIQRGASPRPIAKYITDNEDGVPWIKIGDTSPGSKYVNSTAQRVTLEGAKKSRILNEGDFIISNSMSFGRPYILGIRGAIHDGWASISDFGEKLNSDYLYHYLSSNSVQNYWVGKINSGSVSNLNADIIKTLQIPIPALSEQVRIASLLDKFDTLTHDLSEGLPREIALRQKQYEYYRNLLLNFPKTKEEQ